MSYFAPAWPLAAIWTIRLAVATLDLIDHMMLATSARRVSSQYSDPKSCGPVLGF